ncbi:MAG: hypothetical protein R3D03_07845 [Geminicoccaceae bacterium]
MAAAPDSGSSHLDMPVGHSASFDQEIQASGWLLTPPDDDHLWRDHDNKWVKALPGSASIRRLSGDVGHA